MQTGLNLCSWSTSRTRGVLHVPQCERYKRTAITPQESDVGLDYREHRLRDYGEREKKKTYLSMAPDSGPLSVAHTRHLYLA